MGVGNGVVGMSDGSGLEVIVSVGRGRVGNGVNVGVGVGVSVGVAVGVAVGNGVNVMMRIGVGVVSALSGNGVGVKNSMICSGFSGSRIACQPAGRVAC